MELRGYDTGTYYWKVAAIDAGGAEGRFSDLWRFALARAPASTLLPPTLSVETLELKGNVLHVRGRTEPGATLIAERGADRRATRRLLQRVRHLRAGGERGRRAGAPPA